MQPGTQQQIRILCAWPLQTCSAVPYKIAPSTLQLDAFAAAAVLDSGVVCRNQAPKFCVQCLTVWITFLECALIDGTKVVQCRMW